jgi:hypothetical protein
MDAGSAHNLADPRLNDHSWCRLEIVADDGAALSRSMA